MLTRKVLNFIIVRNSKENDFEGLVHWQSLGSQHRRVANTRKKGVTSSKFLVPLTARARGNIDTARNSMRAFYT